MTWDTVNVLIISWAGKIVWKLVGKILNVLEMYRVGKCWVHCPFPCNVLAMYQLSTPPLAPSVSTKDSVVVVEVRDVEPALTVGVGSISRWQEDNALYLGHKSEMWYRIRFGWVGNY